MTDFILTETHTVTTVNVTHSASPTYSLQTTAELTGVHPEMLQYYCRLGLLGTSRAQQDREPTFDDSALYEVRRIEHFRRQHDVNRRALPVLCELLFEVERLQAELRFLRGR